MAQKVAPLPTLQQPSESSPHLHLNGAVIPTIDQLQVLERLKQLRVWQQQQQESLLRRQQEQLARLRDEEDSRRRQVSANLTGDRSSTAASSLSSREPTLLPDIKPTQTPVADSTEVCSSNSATSSPPLYHSVPPGTVVSHTIPSVTAISHKLQHEVSRKPNGTTNFTIPRDLTVDVFDNGIEVDSMSADSAHSSPSCQSADPNDNVPRTVKVANTVPARVDGKGNETTTSESSLSTDSGLAADGPDECQESNIQEIVLRDQDVKASDHEEQQVQVCYLLTVNSCYGCIPESSNQMTLICTH